MEILEKNNLFTSIDLDKENNNIFNAISKIIKNKNEFEMKENT